MKKKQVKKLDKSKRKNINTNKNKNKNKQVVNIRIGGGATGKNEPSTRMMPPMIIQQQPTQAQPQTPIFIEREQQPIGLNNQQPVPLRVPQPFAQPEPQPVPQQPIQQPFLQQAPRPRSPVQAQAQPQPPPQPVRIQPRPQQQPLPQKPLSGFAAVLQELNANKMFNNKKNGPINPPAVAQQQTMQPTSVDTVNLFTKKQFTTINKNFMQSDSDTDTTNDNNQPIRKMTPEEKDAYDARIKQRKQYNQPLSDLEAEKKRLKRNRKARERRQNKKNP